jgi:hypothetical protein
VSATTGKPPIETREDFENWDSDPFEWVRSVARVARITMSTTKAAEQILGAAFIVSDIRRDGTVVIGSEELERMDRFISLLDAADFFEHLPTEPS